MASQEEWITAIRDVMHPLYLQSIDIVERDIGDRDQAMHVVINACIVNALDGIHGRLLAHDIDFSDEQRTALGRSLVRTIDAAVRKAIG